MTFPAILVIVGLIAFFIGLTGGGFKAKGVDLPKLGRWPRVLTSLIGIALILIGLYLEWLTIPSIPPPPKQPEVARLMHPPHKPGEVVVEFLEVDTFNAPGHIVAAAPYLHEFGISVTNLEPEKSEVVLINNIAYYKGGAVRPGKPENQNFITQLNTDFGPASFTLKFSEPLKSLSFTRPAMYAATESGITLPAWSAHALDAEDRELSSQREEMLQSYHDVPAQTYILRAPGLTDIVAVRFDFDPRRNGKPFAGAQAILIERLTLNRRSEPAH